MNSSKRRHGTAEHNVHVNRNVGWGRHLGAGADDSCPVQTSFESYRKTQQLCLTTSIHYIRLSHDAFAVGQPDNQF